ncbi:MAG: hypothetical protein FJ096_15860 [Deltaproteobacteria bacterium]|nr:hypothetical protein [Deltaproteobacteria bacterium]
MKLRSALLALVSTLSLVGCGDDGPKKYPQFSTTTSTTASSMTSASGAATTSSIGPTEGCFGVGCPCITACHPRSDTVPWKALPTEGAPSARKLHGSVWTGKEMLVWGGVVDGAGNPTADGAAYDPATDTWRPLATKDAPSARHSHQVVWTGTAMLVWGGYQKGGYAKNGAAYDPATDSWTPIGDAPINGRTRHGAAWTGSELVVWGGLGGSALSDGARYAPASKTWTKLPGSGPKARASHVVAWSGSELLVWGGTDTFDWFADGKRLDLAGSGWSDVASSGAPSLRESASGVWASDRLLVWGGWNGGDYLDNGAVYDPTTNAWAALSSDAPVGRAGHVTIWTGDELFVWGGCTGDSCGVLLADGGRYAPTEGWTKIKSDPALSPRSGASGVWTGSEVIVFGGNDVAFKPLGGGARAAL